jgi:hypothetical protein
VVGAKVGRLEASGADAVGADAHAETESHEIGTGGNFAGDDEILLTIENPFLSVFALQKDASSSIASNEAIMN